MFSAIKARRVSPEQKKRAGRLRKLAEALKTRRTRGLPERTQPQSFAPSLFKPLRLRHLWRRKRLLSASAKTRGASQPGSRCRTQLGALHSPPSNKSVDIRRTCPQASAEAGGPTSRQVRSDWINNQSVNLFGGAGDLQVPLPSPRSRFRSRRIDRLRPPSFSRDGGRQHLFEKGKEKARRGG